MTYPSSTGILACEGAGISAGGPFLREVLPWR